jgi:hypothetical protein
MEAINLDEIRTQLKGKPFYRMVEHHLDGKTQDKRIYELQGTIAMLPGKLQKLAEDFIAHWNQRAYNNEFWQTDTSNVFDEIVADAEDVISEAGLHFDDKTLFKMFNIVVLSYAQRAYNQPEIKKSMGLKKNSSAWLSTLSLLYPVNVMVHIATTKTPATLSLVLGYGLSNLGCLLAAAGIFRGTFRIFGLKKRLHVFVAAIIFFLIGTLFSYISP